MDFGGDFGSVLVEKNVWPFLVEKMGSPPKKNNIFKLNDFRTVYRVEQTNL